MFTAANKMWTQHAPCNIQTCNLRYDSGTNNRGSLREELLYFVYLIKDITNIDIYMFILIDTVCVFLALLLYSRGVTENTCL